MLKLWIIASFAVASFVQASDIEKQLEVTFFSKFAHFIEWKEKREWFTITIIDENPFGTLLDQFYQSKSINEKSVRIRYVKKIEDIGDTDILYVTLETTKARQEAIDYAKQKGILTISQAKGFVENGGIIQINFVEQRTKLKINNDAALASGIKIGAPLLSVATVVKGGVQ